MSPSVFALKTSPQTLQADVDRAFDQPALAALSRERPVWIKVNGNFNLEYPGSNTSPWFMRALLSVMKDRGFRTLTVVEGDLPEFRAESMAKTTRLLEVLAPFAVPFLSYERLPRDGRELPKALSEVQLLNVPVFHTHGQSVISCATKNLFGLLPVDRRKYHRVLNDKLLELASWAPCATLVDGTVGLEGESTRRGDPVRCDVLLGGADVLAIDVVAAKTMGFRPEEIPLLAEAISRGRLDPAAVRVTGDFEDLSSVPDRRFRLEIGRIRRVGLWLIQFDIDLEPLLAVTDPVRVLWHRLNRWQKRERLAEGPWKDYTRAS
jgi:uncharacterized protein (DUF362 family)